ERGRAGPGDEPCALPHLQHWQQPASTADELYRRAGKSSRKEGSIGDVAHATGRCPGNARGCIGPRGSGGISSHYTGRSRCASVRGMVPKLLRKVSGAGGYLRKRETAVFCPV